MYTLHPIYCECSFFRVNLSAQLWESPVSSQWSSLTLSLLLSLCNQLAFTSTTPTRNVFWKNVKHPIPTTRDIPPLFSLVSLLMPPDIKALSSLALFWYFFSSKFVSISDIRMCHAMSWPFSILMRRMVLCFQPCHFRRQQLNTNRQAHINQRSWSRELLLLSIQPHSAKTVVNTSSVHEIEGYTFVCVR